MRVLVPFAIVGVIVCVDLWVLADARGWARRGEPVVFRFGSFAIATPEAWAVACLLLFVIFTPTYLVARRS